MNKLILRYIAMILLFVSVLFVSACSSNNSLDETTTLTINLNNNIELSTTLAAEKTTQRLDAGTDIGGADLILNKYRINYYDVPAPFSKHLDLEEFQAWYRQVILENHNENNVMVMKRFIQHFNISREIFDKANLEWAKIIKNSFDGVPMMNPQDFSNQETDEVYNADILYTFDDEIINNYYLSHDYPFTFSDEYEDAVKNGTYQTQTTDWIDIEQMEAEIIAKYGEAEIVTEVTEQTEAETTAEELSEAQINE